MPGKSRSRSTKHDGPAGEAATEPRFEEAMEQLEGVVERLEAGDIALEDSLEAFEKGVGLVRLLHTQLDAVQEKIEELARSDRGEPVTRALADDE